MAQEQKCVILWEGKGAGEYLNVISRVLKYNSFYLSSAGNQNNVGIWMDPVIMPFNKEYDLENAFTDLIPYAEKYQKAGYPIVLFVLDNMPSWMKDKNGNLLRGRTYATKYFAIAKKPTQYSMHDFLMCNLMYPVWHEYMHLVLSLISHALSAELDNMPRFHYQGFTFDKIPAKLPNILVKAKRTLFG